MLPEINRDGTPSCVDAHAPSSHHSCAWTFAWTDSQPSIGVEVERSRPQAVVVLKQVKVAGSARDDDQGEIGRHISPGQRVGGSRNDGSRLGKDRNLVDSARHGDETLWRVGEPSEEVDPPKTITERG